MTDKSHWENIYTSKPVQDVSWYRKHLNTSLDLIEKWEIKPATLQVGPERASSSGDLSLP